MHGEVAQPQAEQQARELQVARHLATDRDRHASPGRGLNRVRDQRQDRRVQRVVEVGHRVVGAVDGEGVLDQVVGADRQEIEPPHENRQRERRGRDLDHAADLDVALVGLAALVELLLRLAEERERLLDLVQVREHRQQDAHLAVVRGAQDGAQLREEHLRLGEAPADGAQPHRRVGHGAAAAVADRDRLVGADVERAQHHRPAGHRLRHLPVSLELLVLARQVAAVEEQELGAEQAHALGARLQHLGHVLRQLDVGVELDRRAVERRRGRGLEQLQPLAL